MPKVVDADQRRGELADAAARVIEREGIDGASLREVAREAGWTTGALVHYFANKRELLAFTLQSSLDRRRSRHRDRSSLPAEEALRAMLFEALPISRPTRLHWIVTLAFAAQASADAELAAIQRDAYLSFRSTITSLLRDSDDTAPREALEREAERLIALVDGIALQALFDPLLWTASKQQRALEAGLAPRSTAER
ncbi:TetR/AcrR family transcriptional regulator [Ilumatobacter nonamiensis]|uniref:TetR/AcrR family transcriptional regulator n=1 Tax=Ilumatobacter nonamiensis TaxID=467093 RepID=UPI00034652F3|nr:TetR/AcrR family transcriptional regulator [Ilumatobacter nonamiensis]